MTTKITAEELAAAFAEDEREHGPARTGLCPLGQILADAQPDIATVLRSKINSTTVTTTTLFRVFKKLGFPSISEKTIRAHRHGTCRCPKDEA